MSLRQLQRAWETPCNSPAEKLVLLALADHANDAGHCYPGVERLAKRTGISERHIKSMIGVIEANGRMRVEHRRGRKRRNNYWLHLSQKGEASSPFETAKGEASHREKVKPVPINGEASSLPLYPPEKDQGNRPPVFASTIRKQLEALDIDERKFRRNKSDNPEYWQRGMYRSPADGQEYNQGWKPTAEGEAKLAEFDSRRRVLSAQLDQAI